MAESRAEGVIATLDQCSESLRSALKQEPDGVVSAVDQLAAENAIAVGIAVLASEEPTEPATTPSTRPILGKDLLITVDLVRRALQSHDSAKSSES